jgi:hypothetical protein
MITQNKNGHIGYALILSNTTFTENTFTDKKDVERVVATFEELGFLVKTRTNLTAEQMVKKMKKDAESSKLKDYSCFVCIIMAHGNFDKIYGVDDKFFSLEEDIIPHYALCPSLTGKPKLFFVEVCEGELGTELVGERFENYSNYKEFDYADICIQYITDNKKSALRRRQHDAHSIQILCDALNELAPVLEFNAICRMVAKRVVNLGFQLSTTCDSLLKNLYF